LLPEPYPSLQQVLFDRMLSFECVGFWFLFSRAPFDYGVIIKKGKKN
jgi:hypothetical protein